MTLNNTKNALALITAIALSAGLSQAANADTAPSVTNSQEIQSSTMSANSSGQWRTMSNGCSYSRAQAPGYAPTWHLIVNPQSMGLPSRPNNCKPMLQDS